MTVRILLADDDASLRRVLQFKLERQGFAVTAAGDGAEALDRLTRERFDLLLSDIRMPRLSGIELLERVRGVQPDLEVIFISAHAEVAQAVQAVKLGAFDYLTKPFEDEQLFVAIDKALEHRRLAEENRLLRGRLRGRDVMRKLVGVSRPFREMMALVEKIAPTDATVLIAGESGTGKEMIARAIHYGSHRADRELVVVNCAAIPRDLIESELFGHVRGAFTGAVRDKRGKFELADRGTLFLDEIAELSIDLQAKLLRAIQEKTIEPVGAEKPVEMDVRLIAATNVDLKERAARGRFREDLYYRLNVIPLRVPSLRERREDIPILVKEFARAFAPSAPLAVDAELMARLAAYAWPGNIRELENLIERMAILRRGEVLTTADLPPDFGRDVGPAEARPAAGDPEPERTLPETEKQLIIKALTRTGGNRSRAALQLGIPRHVLVYRMKKYGLHGPDA
ncbi:MAG TPA: sigma-54 dependent transcriptional regulator [candidate division Zixibacteria bacterium]|nr:sigma-54-dependent Fis family transcriptional regulator [candidate division Zixibacteria bacterium]MDD4917930.1 sigma-54 dependent transcriptional regulator [candidate division Zixibacteria bacterium]MDM7972518.1 sigma-54 dependent transcriptional regulator [candidate division Zixibacteria bacterium]HOD65227.1 sigma-54 dependent transcriptional regulator [candidate division Zixibacteria bacterium]HOZ07247.1 sigma-54 dependent transcriptional regulator [candidate division Zixibacteria bacteri